MILICSLKFPESVINETKNLNETISEKEIKKRKDLRNILTFTIDPDDAKDFDDALSIEIEKIISQLEYILQMFLTSLIKEIK